MMLQLMHWLKNLCLSDESAQEDVRQQIERFFLGDEPAMEDAPATEDKATDQEAVDEEEEYTYRGHRNLTKESSFSVHWMNDNRF